MIRVLIAAGATIGALFIGASAALAQILPQTNAWTQVASGDSNVTFSIGTTTQAMAIESMGVFVSNPDGTGVQMQLRLTCFANIGTGSQTGCTFTGGLTSATTTIYNTNAQVIYFNFPSGTVLQSGKVYVMEIMESFAQASSFDVYGDVVFQFANQCSGFWGGPDCSGAPYYTFNSLPNWAGINATTTPLTALYQNATNTLNQIQTRCVRDGSVDFGYAMCSAFAFLFVPDPNTYNAYNAALDTAQSRFPVSWYNGIADTYEGLTASSTANMATVSINFASVDPATSTPFGPILPNATILSSTTISTYLTPTILTLLLTLEIAAIWVLFSLFIFFDVQRRFFRH